MSINDTRYNFYLTETDFEDDDENEVLDPFGIYEPLTDDEEIDEDEDEDEETDDEVEETSDETESTGYKIIEDDEDIDLTNKVI